MRPLRLMIKGFGSYREPADISLSDVDFFVLTGPTGSGKSTVIDALCFALYGTVPRWGREKGIRNALAPSAVECRVGLVFEVGGQRYVVARRLARNARDVVQTKEVRLERLDDSVPVDAELDRLLEVSAEQIAEGTHVTDAVTRLLGIGYEHFTQCVLLPQGRFAEFLNATPGDRQDLLIELLAYAVYENVGQRARERAKVATSRADLLGGHLAEQGDVTPEMIEAAECRVRTLAELAPVVDKAVESLAALRDGWMEAHRQATSHREQVAALAGLRMPADVPGLAADLGAADDRVVTCLAEEEELEHAETGAEGRLAGLAERSVLDRWHDAHARNAQLGKELATARRRLQPVESTEDSLARDLERAQSVAAEAAAAVHRTEQEHRAVALVAELRPGEPCPVCRQKVGAVPHHEVPADLGSAHAKDKAAKASVADAQKRLTAAGRTTAAARSRVEGLEDQLADVATVLVDAPPAGEVDVVLATRKAADAALEQTRRELRVARVASTKAHQNREQLRVAERRAWSTLRTNRERFVALSAPCIDGTDLVAAWQTLLDWAKERHRALDAEAGKLDAAEKTLRDKGKADADELIGGLAGHGVTIDDATKAPVALAKHRVGAERDLAELRDRQERAGRLRAEIAVAREESEVAAMLGNLLRSDGFERWLCAEALDLLVLEASETLMQLSGGQYELDRGERNEFVVIDHNDAGTRRPVNTLSGGETFQASLALALALSHQVMALSGGRRRLDAMFLDEGFGTLDEATLDTVASTLERLVEQTGSMIGIVTHVPALAERVPVQFAVTRTGASSRVERVSV